MHYGYRKSSSFIAKRFLGTRAHEQESVLLDFLLAQCNYFLSLWTSSIKSANVEGWKGYTPGYLTLFLALRLLQVLQVLSAAIRWLCWGMRSNWSILVPSHHIFDCTRFLGIMRLAYSYHRSSFTLPLKCNAGQVVNCDLQIVLERRDAVSAEILLRVDFRLNSFVIFNFKKFCWIWNQKRNVLFTRRSRVKTYAVRLSGRKGQAVKYRDSR